MRAIKKSWQSVLYILILLVAISVLFLWYSTTNSERIEQRNLNYAMDSARQTADRIASEFANAHQRIRNYTFFIDKGLHEPNISQSLLAEMEENSAFDAMRYINADGLKFASNGSTSESADREYFLRGIAGETGSDVVFQSRMTNETMMAFYAPLRYDDEIFGVLLGVYFAEDYLQDMLQTTYFGERANVFLCTRDGMVIASSDTNEYDRPLPDMMLESGAIDAKSAAGAWAVFEQGGEGGFICDSESLTDNLCVLSVQNSEYFLVQTFPLSVTSAMIGDANYTATILQAVLIGIFALYILLLLFQARSDRRRLEGENQELGYANQELGYVISGVNTLFARFLLADFESNGYRYLAGTRAEREGFPVSGRYEDYVNYLCSLFSEEDDRQTCLNALALDKVSRKLATEPALQYEYQIQRADGSIAWEHLNVIRLEQKGDRVCKALFLRQDITEVKERDLRNQAQISLADRKERQYQIAITSSAFCTFEFDLTRDCIDQDVTRMLDGQRYSFLDAIGLKAPCSASECFEKWSESFILEESRDEYREAVDLQRLRELFEQGESEVTIDYWGWETPGRQMCVRQSFIMTRDDEGDISVMVVCKDITSQVQKQREQTQALQEALLQAQHASNAKTAFLSNMSHDIRTPMNAIIGFTTIAVSHIDNKSQVQDCLQKVLSSSNHLLSLINDILDMSRIESGKVQIKEQECNISELTHNLVNIIQPQVKAKQLDLFIDTFDVANEDVIADSLKLSQVFVNLLSNAVKYTPAGGTVSFRIIQQTTFHRGYGDYVFLVKDNGIGMSQDFVDHIFEPFTREASTTKTGIQGTGLGMAITKNIIDMMGGTITVQSQKGAGSEFRVELSLKLQNVEKNAAQIKELEGLRALVVDDDCDSCESVSRMLKQIGMRAEWTTSGREAAYRAKGAHNDGDSYHTYIIDWQMPELSGIETTRRIRAAIGKEAPIIILTAYDWTDIEEEAKQAGVTAFCAKPLFMSDLKATLLGANNLLEKTDEASWTQMDFSGKRILLVEDNELNREIAEAILEETGFVVESAPDGTDAVAMMRRAEEHYYDAILMDVQMPVMDGYEATRTIRALPREDVKTLPIIAMTANAMEEDKEAALKNGMNAHIAKPINIDLFLAILGKQLS